MTHSARPRLLLADDDVVTREVVAAMLERDGFDCEMATTGSEAVTRVLAEPFTAVILDFEMPELDGLEATRRIRQRERGRRTPIVMLSSHASEQDNALGAGADAYLVKPVTPALLHEVLARFGRAEPSVANVERFSDVLELFLELTPERISRLRDAAVQDDVARARSEAHRMIGSCAVLGFPRMAAMARRIASGELSAGPGAEQLTRELEQIQLELAVCRDRKCSR